MPRHNSTLRLSILAAALVILYALTCVSISTAQTPETNYGCLKIDDGSGASGLYDLNRGTYITVPMTSTPNQQKILSVSSDKNYTATYLQDTNQAVLIDRHGVILKTIDLTGFIRANEMKANFLWSPDSRYVAFSGYFGQASETLFIVPVEMQPVQNFSISLGIVSMYWTPDSRYLLISVQNKLGSDASPASGFDAYGLRLYRVDGMSEIQVTDQALTYQDCSSGYCVSHAAFTWNWSPTAKSIFYLQFVSDSPRWLNLMAYRVDQKQNVLLAKNISDVPAFSADGNFALIQWQGENKTHAGMLDTMTGRLSPLSDDTQTPYLAWIGDKALARWDTYIIVSNAGSTVMHRIDLAAGHLMNVSDAVGTRGVDWSPDQRWLLLPAIADDGPMLWLVDLTTEKSQTLGGFSILALLNGSVFSLDSRFLLLIQEGTLYLFSLVDGSRRQIHLDTAFDSTKIQQLIWLPANNAFVIVYILGEKIILVSTEGAVLKTYDNWPLWSNITVLSARWSDCGKD